MPEFEVRLYTAGGTVFKSVPIDAASERAALAKAATLAKQNKASFFDVRHPLSRRWIKRAEWW
jgi:hypothetical protein